MLTCILKVNINWKINTLNFHWCEIPTYGIHIGFTGLSFGIHDHLNYGYSSFFSHGPNRVKFAICDSA